MSLGSGAGFELSFVSGLGRTSAGLRGRRGRVGVGLSGFGLEPGVLGVGVVSIGRDGYPGLPEGGDQRGSSGVGRTPLGTGLTVGPVGKLVGIPGVGVGVGVVGVGVGVVGDTGRGVRVPGVLGVRVLPGTAGGVGVPGVGCPRRIHELIASLSGVSCVPGCPGLLSLLAILAFLLSTLLFLLSSETSSSLSPISVNWLASLLATPQPQLRPNLSVI